MRWHKDTAERRVQPDAERRQLGLQAVEGKGPVVRRRKVLLAPHAPPRESTPSPSLAPVSASASASASASTAPAPVAPAAPAASASEAEPKTKGATAEGVRAKRQLQQLDENVPVAPSSKQLKPAEQAAQAESTSNYGAGGLPLDAKAVGKSVRAALRGHPELQTSTLKQLRVHLETKLGDLTEWKGEIKKVTQAFMQAKAQAEA